MNETAIDIPLATDKPTCLSLVVATIIWIDPKSQVKTIIQPLGAIGVPVFPAKIEGLPIYFAITGAIGKYRLRMALTGPGDNERKVFEMGCETDIQKDGIPTDFAFHVPPITFHEPGMYWLRFYWENELLMERRLPVYTGNPDDVQ